MHANSGSVNEDAVNTFKVSELGILLKIGTALGYNRVCKLYLHKTDN